MGDSKSGCSIGLIIAVAALVVIMFIFRNLFWWLLGIVAVLLILGIILIVYYNNREKKKKQELVTDGITVGDVDEYIKKCDSRLQEVRRSYYKLKDDEMRRELDLISDRYRKIAKITREDPKDFKATRRFLNMMFTSLETIVSQSVTLFEAPSRDEEIDRSLKDAKDGMGLLRQSMDSHINKMHENNILELDVEIEVLKKTLASRGLLDDDTAGEAETKGESNE